MSTDEKHSFLKISNRYVQVWAGYLFIFSGKFLEITPPVLIATQME